MLPPLFTWIPQPQLPKIPEHFVQLGMDKINAPSEENQNFKLSITTQEYMDRKIIQNGREINSKCQINFHLGKEWESWVRENIHPNFEETGIRLSVGDSTTAGPHVDNPGKLRFYYLIDRGGEAAETIWYMKPGKPIIFDADSWNKPYPYSYDNVDELVPIDRAYFPLNTWILFNGYILHGVNNVTCTRINFNVSIKPENTQIGFVR